MNTARRFIHYYAAVERTDEIRKNKMQIVPTNREELEDEEISTEEFMKLLPETEEEYHFMWQGFRPIDWTLGRQDTKTLYFKKGHPNPEFQVLLLGGKHRQI